jgi:hypothetical protein
MNRRNIKDNDLKDIDLLDNEPDLKNEKLITKNKIKSNTEPFQKILEKDFNINEFYTKDDKRQKNIIHF